jgi:hypothetical protein
MAVDDDDFLAAVARHLVGGFLQEPEAPCYRQSFRVRATPAQLHARRHSAR